jgi:hypothetical protein
MIIRAALCPSPPLLARELTGREEVLPELRRACAAAVARLLDARPDVVAVVGSGPETAAWDGSARLDLARYAPALRARPRGGAGTAAGLPLAPGLGAMLLDEAGYEGPLLLRAVGEHADPGECARLGAALAREPRAGLLVMGDGTARRGPAAPGHFDERAAAFDAAAERAVRSGDLAALAALDPGLARDLMATGRAAWQVLAGALPAAAPGDVRYAAGPFGVWYLVAVLDPA